jgi:hypothetical protein
MYNVILPFFGYYRLKSHQKFDLGKPDKLNMDRWTVKAKKKCLLQILGDIITHISFYSVLRAVFPNIGYIVTAGITVTS